MNQYVTGATIKALREKNKMTQLAFADKLGVSDKTVSKWETGRGYPDISLLEPIAKVFSVSITELLSGNAVENKNVAGNMRRTKFYVCPICGNMIHSLGEALVSCHGTTLPTLEAEEVDDRHAVTVEQIEYDYYVHIDHEMTKSHYISFIAAISFDGMQIKKLYPEGEAEARFPNRGVKEILFYCNRDGLYRYKIRG